MKGIQTVSAPLTDFCASVQPAAGFIGSKILPYVPVGDVTGWFPKFQRRDVARVEETARPFNGVARHRTVQIGTQTYNCYPGHAWREFLTDLELNTATKKTQEQMRKAIFAQNTILLSQESRIATKVMTAGNHVNTVTLNSSGTDGLWQFDKYTGSTGKLLTIIDVAKDKLFNPDPSNCKLYAAISKDVFNILKNHPDVIARVSGGGSTNQPARVLLQTLADLFEVEEVYVGDVQPDSTTKKATPTYTSLWTWNMLFFYKAQIPTKNASSFGYTFMYAPNVLGAEEVKNPDLNGIKDGWRVRVYRDEALGGGADVVEVEQYPDEQIVMSDAACLIVNAIGAKTPS